MKQYIDRGQAIKGHERTSRDSRIPFNFPRLIENFSLPDSRLRRRTGFREVHSPHVTQALCKSTGVQYSKRFGELNTASMPAGAKQGVTAHSPLSYGVIRHQADYQLKRSQSATIEFMVRLGDKEELVRNPLSRVTNGSYVLREPGVYILDQSVLANHHDFQTGNISHGAVNPIGVVTPAAPNNLTYPLTTFAFGYTETKLFFIFGMVEKSGGTAGMYWPKNQTMQFTFPGGSYTPGDVYHVAIVHDISLGASGRLILYINGTSHQTLDLPSTSIYGFIGEYDDINGIVYASGLKRDIVVLNEATVRASYASTIKVATSNHGSQTYFHDHTVSPDTGFPIWATSPPRGTALWDLRIWTEARSSGNISTNKGRRIYPTDSGISNLKGNWFLNDGGPICKNQVTNLEKRYCSIHHGYPGYINESKFVHGLGMKLDDGQHLTLTSLVTDRDLGSGLSAKMSYTFGHTSATGTSEHQDRHSFTVQMQLMVPDALQPEINDFNDAAGLVMRDITLTETRRGMNIHPGAVNGASDLRDGEADDGTLARAYVHHPTEGVAPWTIRQWHRAYDQTLWSIEGRQKKNSSENAFNEPDRRRVPIARGLITPAGKVAFELYKLKTSTGAYILRLLSASTLVVGTVYAITFVQRPIYTIGSLFSSDGWKMEIWIQNLTAGTAAALDSSFTVAAEGSTDIHTSPMNHQPDYDINIGASYVNDSFDFGVKAPDPAALPGPWPSTFIKTGAGNNRLNHGPWPVQQRFMSPYQDQPGNIVVGCFRIWSLALPDGSIKEFGNSSISGKDYSNDLLVNLEFEEITGSKVPSKCRYPEVFDSGFKSWGMPQGYASQVINTGTLGPYVYAESYEGGWAMEDCLGYTYIAADVEPQPYTSRQRNTVVRGISPFKSSVAQQFGVLTVYDDSLAFDKEVQGSYLPLFITSNGLLSDFTSGSTWQGTAIGDRTFLTAFGGIPKVFNGRTATVAGFRRWTGGQPYLGQFNTGGGGGLTVGLWYGVVIVYFSEQYNIYHIAPVQTVKILTGHNALRLINITPHPDPRISIVEIYRTAGQSSESLALSAPLYKTPLLLGNLNAATTLLDITGDDTTLFPTVLDRNVTEFPLCAYSASLNGRLYLTGDLLNPDAIYFTDEGNPERIDTLVNRIDLEEGSGDAPTGLVAAFGSLFLFKPNALWRIDDIGGNRHQQIRLASIGAIVDSSIQLIVNPDTGRSSIFFWSQHGPYMFDGSTFQYIGAPIEEHVVGGIPSKQYHWLDPRTVVVAHSSNEREIICIYTPKAGAGSTSLDKNFEAAVYNYRFGGWTRYNGLNIASALSLSFTGDTRLATTPTDSELAVASQNFTYRLIIGGENGRVYYWSDEVLDGTPNGFTPVNPYTVTVVASNVLTISSSTPGNFDLSGLTAVVVNPNTGDYQTAPINTNETNTITLDPNWLSLLWGSFVPVVGYQVYLCQPACFVEFPWDECDRPFMDKEVIDLITWHAGDIKYKKALHYDLTAIDPTWSDLVTGTSRRKKTKINKKSEAFKFFFKSHQVGIAIDAIAYFAHYSDDGNTPNA